MYWQSETTSAPHATIAKSYGIVRSTVTAIKARKIMEASLSLQKFNLS